jgi:hypothetical protein
MALMVNKDAMINSCRVILENKLFFSKNHCKIQVRTIVVCALSSIKYGMFNFINFQNDHFWFHQSPQTS